MQNATCETLLSDWFTNSLINVDNETVLLITSSSIFNANNMMELLRQTERPISCRVEHLSKMTMDIDPFKMYRPNVKFRQNNMSEETNPIAKNLVFFIDHQSTTKIQLLINICKKNNKKILFAGAYTASNTLNSIPNIGQNSNIAAKDLPPYSHYYLDYYDSDPIMLVRDNRFKENLKEIIEYRMQFLHGLLGHDIYLDEQIRNKINNDIELFKHTNLLTANLAMHLYRLTFFALEINITKAGRYFRDRLGIKSKTFGSNSKKLKSIGYKPPKSFKAYDLSTNLEKQIRLGIASKIVQHIKSNPNQVLDSDFIAKITELSEEEVEEIYESYE